MRTQGFTPTRPGSDWIAKDQESRRRQDVHNSVLPRVTDAVMSALQLMSAKQSDQQVQLFIADIVDAFWLVPLHVSEEDISARTSKAATTFSQGLHKGLEWHR